MDFSSLNPTTSNALNLAVRNNDVGNVTRLLKKINPNCVDNRGWTCLHEAAFYDSYESLVLILEHPDCRTDVESHEGHTALYLACRQPKTSLRTIKLLLESKCGGVNQSGTEGFTPLHVAAGNENIPLMELLLENGAEINAQDLDGDTPLHSACFIIESRAVEALLQAGANPLIKNSRLYLPLHLACITYSLKAVTQLMPYVKDINQRTAKGETPLMLTIHSYGALAYDDYVPRMTLPQRRSNNKAIFNLLLENGADPNLKNDDNKLALDIACENSYRAAFTKLLELTNEDMIDVNIVWNVIAPHNFCLDILEELLSSKLGPKFFKIKKPVEANVPSIKEVELNYVDHAPLNNYIDVAEYLFLMDTGQLKTIYDLFLKRGLSVNARENEYPPLAYIHCCTHSYCFATLFGMMLKDGLNVDYCSNEMQCIPDSFIASMIHYPDNAPIMLSYSLYCDPDSFIKIAANNSLLDVIPIEVQKKLMSQIDIRLSDMTAIEYYTGHFVPPLKHISRLQVRDIIKLAGNGKQKNTQEYLKILNNLPLPRVLKEYVQFV